MTDKSQPIQNHSISTRLSGWRTVRRQYAFSVLELLIALGLLGALLAVAWSLLGTYRRAEQRGWNLADRTQSTRLVREWLERDLFQIALPERFEEIDPQVVGQTSQTAIDFSGTVFESSPTSNTQPRFEGNQYGFTTVVRSSFDPMPFVERLLNESGQSSQADTDSARSGAEFGGSELQPSSDLVVSEAADLATSPLPLWPPDQVTVEYRLRPVNPSALGQDEGGNWLLVRTERTELGTANESKSRSEADSSERVLTGADLYRLNEDERNSERQLHRESVISRLSAARFSYYDGTQWKSTWSGQAAGRLPVAIALELDVPQSLSSLDRRVVVSPEPESETTFDSLAESAGLGEAEFSAEISDESGFGDLSSPQRDVRIVIRLWQTLAMESRTVQ